MIEAIVLAAVAWTVYRAVRAVWLAARRPSPGMHDWETYHRGLGLSPLARCRRCEAVVLRREVDGMPETCEETRKILLASSVMDS